MAIKERDQVIASVILSTEHYEEVKRIAKKNKRSASSQMAIAIEKMIEEEQMELI